MLRLSTARCATLRGHRSRAALDGFPALDLVALFVTLLRLRHADLDLKVAADQLVSVLDLGQADGAHDAAQLAHADPFGFAVPVLDVQIAEDHAAGVSRAGNRVLDRNVLTVASLGFLELRSLDLRGIPPFGDGVEVLTFGKVVFVESDSE